MNVYIRTIPDSFPTANERKLLELTWPDLANKVTLRYFPPGRDYSGPPLTAWGNGETIPCTVDPTSLRATVHPPSSFRDDIPLKLFTHGFDDRTKPDASHNSEAYQFVKAWQDYHKDNSGFDVGVILVNWSFWARGPLTRYDVPARNSIDVGHFTGRCLAALVRWTRLQARDIHLVGHSLGAQLMGKAGRTMALERAGLPGRLTGLDPAGPRFFEGPLRSADPDLAAERIDRWSASFVDIIHTNGGFKPAAAKIPMELGAIQQLGHRDFYADGGRWQPGCGLAVANGCSHGRSVSYYLHSLRSPNLFPSQRCATVTSCTEMEASHPASNTLMGEPAERGWSSADTEPELFITDIKYCHWTKRNRANPC